MKSNIRMFWQTILANHSTCQAKLQFFYVWTGSCPFNPQLESVVLLVPHFFGGSIYSPYSEEPFRVEIPGRDS